MSANLVETAVNDAGGDSVVSVECGAASFATIHINDVAVDLCRVELELLSKMLPVYLAAVGAGVPASSRTPWERILAIFW
jgi:hypothetical protein